MASAWRHVCKLWLRLIRPWLSAQTDSSGNVLLTPRPNPSCSLEPAAPSVMQGWLLTPPAELHSDRPPKVGRREQQAPSETFGQGYVPQWRITFAEMSNFIDLLGHGATGGAWSHRFGKWFYVRWRSGRTCAAVPPCFWVWSPLIKKRDRGQGDDKGETLMNPGLEYYCLYILSFMQLILNFINAGAETV